MASKQHPTCAAPPFLPCYACAAAGLVQEVFISRGSAATCPVTTGVIYFGCQQQQQQQQQQTGATVGSAVGAATSSSKAGASEDASAAVLCNMLHQPWVTVTNGLNSAAAVFAAVEVGQLPAVVDYAVGPSAEWIEFDRPTQTEIQQQQQQQGLTAGGSSSSSSTLGGVVMVPALWFRWVEQSGVVSFWQLLHLLPTAA
jgi:hypothetical protein